jgi:hypothetical protein
VEEIRFRLHPKQLEVLTSQANEQLFGGGSGGGKSFLARAAAIVFSLQIPGLQSYLFRRTYPELQSTHFAGPSSFPMLLAPLTDRRLCEIVSHEIRFSNGSRISLNHCQNERDRFRYQGSEIHFLQLDEASHFTFEIYSYLRTRCRLGNLQIPDRFRGKFPFTLLTSNPGGPGHSYLKRMFVDNAEDGRIRKMPESEGGGLRQYIKALWSDNPDLTKNDPDYLSRIKAMPDPHMRAAYLLADWSVAEGSIFASVWDKARHVVRSFPIPSGWSLWRGADDGIAAPACVLWGAHDPIQNRIYVVSELYRAGMLPQEMARRVLERDRTLLIAEPSGQTREHGASLSGLIDAASFADPGNGAPSRGKLMNTMGCGWRPVEKPPGSRVAGIQAIMQHLGESCPDGGPRLKIFESCKVLCEALPSAPRDESNPEDVADFELDHAIDSCRYLLARRERSFARARLTGI